MTWQTLSKRTQALVDEFISIRQKHTAENQRQMERQVKIVLYDSATKGYKKNSDTNEPYTEEEVSKVAVQCYETGTSPFLEALASNTLAGKREPAATAAAAVRPHLTVHSVCDGRCIVLPAVHQMCKRSTRLYKT